MNNQHIAELLSNGSVDFKCRRSIAPAYFRSLIDSDDYKYLTDPIDVAAYEVIASVGVLGYKLRVVHSVVASMAVGYQGGDAQKIIDVVYEACFRAPFVSEELTD